MKEPDSASDPSHAPPPRRLPYWRWLVRGLCFAAALVLFVPLGISDRWAFVVPALSPFVAFASLAGSRMLTVASGLGLLVGFIALWKRRWFCHWVCPTGLVADTATRCGLLFGRRCPRIPSVGPWIAIVTIAGAFVGYPILLWLDPLALLGASFGPFQDGPSSAAWWTTGGVVGVAMISLIWPGLWCVRICPLGATQDTLADATRLLKRIGKRSAKKTVTPSGWTFSRRLILGGTIGAIWATLMRSAITRSALSDTDARLRPPSAVDEGQFAGLCIRCGNCIRVCPTKVVHPDFGGRGIALFLTPEIVFAEQYQYCLEDCTRCADVCPSGALQLLPIEKKMTTVMGVPRVDMDLCLLGDDRECAICRSRCPFEAISLRFSEEEYTLTPQVDPTRCPGCGACQVACPTTPDKAIVIVPLSRRA